MKLLYIIIALLFSAIALTAQTNLEKANTCYDAKDYQCAIDNYLVSLANKSFKDGQQYILEYRIGNGYSQLVKDDKALEYFQKSVASNPNYLYSLWGVADSYYNLKKYTEAVDNYKKAYSLATTAIEKEDLTWWLAETYFAMKKHREAITEYKKIISRTENFYKTDVILGDEYYTLANYDSALLYYIKAEEFIKPTDKIYKSLKCYIGKCYRIQGKTDLALQQQDAALAVDPKYGLAMWEKGVVYAGKKDYATAIDWYKKSIATYSGDSTNSYTLSGNIAACYQNLNNYNEELNWYQKRKTFSTNPYVEYTKIATIQYGRLKQVAAAEKTATEAAARYQLEPELMKTKAKSDYANLSGIAGKITLERKDTVMAQKYFDAALKISSASYTANAGAGDIAWARKKEDEYKKYYNNIAKSTYDTLLFTKKEIANVYGRSAYVDANISKYSAYTYSYSITSALSFDSLQHEAILLWPVMLNSKEYSYQLAGKRDACLSVLNKAIKQYSSDKEYVSTLYNSKAVMLLSTDTLAIRKALEEAVKVYPENISAWDNLLKYYSSYDNAAGAVMVDKLITVLKKKKDNATTATAYVYKGDFFWRLTKKEDAKKAYQEALVWDANNATAKERAKLE